MSDERADAIEAVALWLAGEDGDLEDFPTNAGQARDYQMDRARNIVAVVAPFMAGSGEAEDPSMPPEYVHRDAYRVVTVERDEARGEAERLRAAAKRVLEADMRGVRDIDALNALEDAAGFSQQGQRRAAVFPESSRPGPQQ